MAPHRQGKVPPFRGHGAGSPTVGRYFGNAAKVVQAVSRSCYIGFALMSAGARGVLSWLASCAMRRRGSAGTVLGRIARESLARAEGVFPKIGQIASTRPDLLSPDFRSALLGLRDACRAVSVDALGEVLRREAAVSGDLRALVLDPGPCGVGAVAQVHVARTGRDGSPVAVKFIKPSAQRYWTLDVGIARAVCRLLDPLAARLGMSLADGVRELEASLSRHGDLAEEAAVMDVVSARLAPTGLVRIPRVRRELCTRRVLAMEFVEDLKQIDAQAVPPEVRKSATLRAMEALFRMIFDLGIVHCDMHPGNLLVDPRGTPVLLDFGGCRRLSERTRKRFREFFFCIAIQDSAYAADLLLEGARARKGSRRRLRKPEFVEAVGGLLSRTANMRVNEFRVATFVGDVFDIHKVHGLVASSDFVAVILALMVFEGTALKVVPDADFLGIATRVLTNPLLPVDPEPNSGNPDHV